MNQATRLLTNGKIFTSNDKNPWAEAVVIKGNKLAYVGTNEGAIEYARGSGAKVEDLGGKLVTPGIIDGHLHFFGANMLEGLPVLNGMTPEEIYKTMKEFIEAHPEKEAFTAVGWNDAAFGEKGPHKKDLDVICSNKPVALISASMHTVWCNSKALELAGITRDTPDIDPAGGVIYQREENGEPTGFAKEIASMDAVMGAAKYFDDSALISAFKKFFVNCAANGLTSVVDCGTLSFLKYIINDKLNALFNREDTQIRLNFCGYAGVSGLYDKALADAADFHERYNNDHFFCTFHKLFNDGTLENASAAIPSPYPSGNIVKPIMDVETLVNRFEACAKAGLDINIHAIGSDSVRNVLRASGLLREKGYKDVRIICSHSAYVYPEDLELFGKYDVFSDTTGCWIAAMDENTEKLAAELTKAKAYPVNSIKKSGTRVGFGSDFPTDPNTFPIMPNIECLVTRQAIGDKNGFIHDKEERISLEEVIKGYTIENAYQMHKEQVLGSIEVGKYADLTIFEQNLFELDPHELHNVKVAQTIKDGLTTYIKS